jgi:hypothetical protein
MIFLRHDGQHELDGTPNFLPSPAPGAKFLFDTNERSRTSFIAVTHSKQTTDPLSVRYKSKRHRIPPLCQKVASDLIPKLRDPRA